MLILNCLPQFFVFCSCEIDVFQCSVWCLCDAGFNQPYSLFAACEHYWSKCVRSQNCSSSKARLRHISLNFLPRVEVAVALWSLFQTKRSNVWCMYMYIFMYMYTALRVHVLVLLLHVTINALSVSTLTCALTVFSLLSFTTCDLSEAIFKTI